MMFVPLAENLTPADPKKAQHYRKDSAKVLLERHAKSSEATMARSQQPSGSVVRQNVEDRVATLGSEETIFSAADCGLFAPILMAYNNHWTLRTSPDDWWFCVTRRVALAIDKNSRKESVRKMFVNHEGKKTLQVDVPSNNIYDVDYSWFFDQMSKKITENVKVPEYVDAVTADFSTTTPVQKIVSQITVMSSLQEFFEFKMVMFCGIPSVEMLGTDDDWAKLQSKLKVLRTLLEPIENYIGLEAEWWSLVEDVFKKLHDTYRGVPDKDWWSRIVTYEGFSSGPSGYTGWINQFMEGTRKLLQVYDFSSGLITVPLTIEDPSGQQDTAALVAGMLGFTIHEDRINQAPSVQPFQGWSLLLPKNSPFH